MNRALPAAGENELAVEIETTAQTGRVAQGAAVNANVFWKGLF